MGRQHHARSLCWFLRHSGCEGAGGGDGGMGEWEWKLVEVSEVKDYVSKGTC